MFTNNARPFSRSNNGTVDLFIVTAFKPCYSVVIKYPEVEGRTATLYSARAVSVDPVYFFDTDELPELAEESLRFTEEQNGNGDWLYYFDLSEAP